MTKLTVNGLITELDEARQIAKDNANPTAMISATMSKAKICGLDNGADDNSQKDIRAIKVDIVDARRH